MNGAGSDPGMKDLIIKMHMAKKGKKFLRKKAIEVVDLLKARRILIANTESKPRKKPKLSKRKTKKIGAKFKGLKSAVITAIKGKK
jgi:tRNA uridine 5-carbamoylmethylation protein Kti12